jgi:hypothetical protein
VRLAREIAAERPLLDALAALRCLGDEGAEAAAALGRTRRVAALRWSWELWEALAEGSGSDPEARLLDVLPVGTIDHARFALWGPSWRSPDGSDDDVTGGVRQ